MGRIARGSWAGLVRTAAVVGLVLCAALPTAAQTALSPTTAPRNPAFERYVHGFGAAAAFAESAGAFAPGLVPTPLDLSHNRGKRVQASSYRALSLPSAYDLRTQNPSRLTLVRNQGGCGSCWAFATYGSLESCLLPSQPCDFSENNLKNTAGFDWGCCDGGNHWISAAYFARWSGPAAESSDLYGGLSCSSPSNLAVVKHVQRIDYLPNRSGFLDNDNIKQAVMTYGAVYTTYYHSDSYYNSTTKAYYCSAGTAANHAVCIVGWDDAYSKSKFKTAPAGNGAFIIRNSWGSSWGESGYFYCSYYDTLIGRDNAVFCNAEPATNYNQIYQYDPLGWVNSVGYSSTTGWFANVFTAANETDIKAVSFYAASPQSGCEVYIYLNPSSGPKNPAGPAAAKTGVTVNCGYQTVVLDAPVRVTSGQTFSVVVKLTTPGYNYPIPFEQPEAGYSSAATANPGESHISPNGSSWSDLTASYPGSNVCLKAFGTGASGIAVMPGSGLDANGPVGGPFSPSSQTYTITNNGAASLNWTASKTSAWLDLSATSGTLAAGASTTVVASVSPSANAFQPGVYSDSVSFTNTTNGNGNTSRAATLTEFANYEIRQAQWAWIDPSGHANLSLSDDSVSTAQTIPFEFKFYEKSYAQLYIGANGLIGFTNDNLSNYSNASIPNSGSPNCALYPHWDDLNPGAGGSVRIATVGSAPDRKLVISWVGVPQYSAPNTTLTFQAVLCEGSWDILFNYLDVKPTDTTYGSGRSATIGLENEKGVSAVNYSYNGSALLRNGQSVLFTSRGPIPSSIKQLPDDAATATRRGVVSAVFGDDLYVGSEDRASGIQVHRPGHGLAAGTRADVAGVLKTNSDGERYIDATSVAQSGMGSVAPVGVSSPAIGGSAFGYNPQTGSGQAGMKAWRWTKVAGAGYEWVPFELPGLNNIGLLVQTWGSVTWVGDGEFYIDDGWGAKDVRGYVGVRISAPGLAIPTLGSFVRVTGVVSCYKVNGTICRMIRIPGQSAIAVQE